MRANAYLAMGLILWAGAALGDAFNVQEIPVADPSARVFVAEANGDNLADLFLLDGHSLRIFLAGRPETPIHIALARGTSAFDVADIDGDGKPELLALAGTQVLKYGLEAPSGAAAPEVLFDAPTIFSEEDSGPFPHVLVVPFEKRKVFALPRQETIELRGITGDLLQTYALGSGAAGQGLVAYSVEPLQAGGPGALEFRMSTRYQAALSLPEELRGGAVGPTQRMGTPQQIREAASKDADSWPWFSLSTEKAGGARALYALAPPGFTNTLIRIDDRTSQVLSRASHGGGEPPKRRYPGIIVPPSPRLPDFNGDGYTDLLLWKAPMPGRSLGSLAQAAQSRRWPLQLAVHLFAPGKSVYEARPRGTLRIHARLSWFIEMERGTPLRNLVLADFDHDGRTDLAMSADAKTMSLWLYRDGFSAKPQFSVTLPTAIHGVEIAPDHGAGLSALVLRGEGAFFVLRLP